jgi:hypothetical protein
MPSLQFSKLTSLLVSPTPSIATLGKNPPLTTTIISASLGGTITPKLRYFLGFSSLSIFQ